jgi:hypothetical protein
MMKTVVSRLDGHEEFTSNEAKEMAFAMTTA